jgi:recombination protein RecT
MQTATATVVAERQDELGEFLQARVGDFSAALPSHIRPEQFMRAALTAATQNPQLRKVDRRSLFLALQRCAQDGLIPDGREAVITIFKSRELGQIAAYMPMVAGIRKLVQQSGEITRFEQTIVYANDDFDYRLGDRPHIFHKPALKDRGPAVLAYSVAQFRDGTLSREIMTIDEIERVRAVSRAANDGPWKHWWSEMARKTIARRHAKILPRSNDLASSVIDRDDDMQLISGPAHDASKRAAGPGGRPKALAAQLDNLASDAGANSADFPASPRELGPPRRGPGRPRKIPRAAGDNPGSDEAAAGPVIEGGAADWPEGDPPAGDAAPPFDGATGALADTGPAADAPAGNVDDQEIEGAAQRFAQAPAPAGDPFLRPDPDFERGFKDAQAGWKNCITAAIKNDERRFDQWRAGWHAWHEQERRGRDK